LSYRELYTQVAQLAAGGGGGGGGAGGGGGGGGAQVPQPKG
jgi:hypothetical protein